MAFFIASIVLPLYIGWTFRFNSFSSNFSNEELHLLSSQLGMSYDKLVYFLDNLNIAITALIVIGIWKLIIWLESRNKRSNQCFELIHQFAIFTVSITFIVKIIKNILS